MDETKVDLKEDFRPIFSASTKEVTFVGIPAFNFLKIDGAGDPNTAKSFQEAVKALYGIAYSIKFANKSDEDTFDFVVAPLEGLWWCDDMTTFSINNKENWKWTLMIMMPEFITEEKFSIAKQTVIDKKEAKLAKDVRFELFDEGMCAQIMHIGSYSEEEPTIQKLHQVILANEFELTGIHHEIYMSDPRKTKPEKLKTIIRQPVVKKAKPEVGTKVK